MTYLQLDRRLIFCAFAALLLTASSTIRERSASLTDTALLKTLEDLEEEQTVFDYLGTLCFGGSAPANDQAEILAALEEASTLHEVEAELVAAVMVAESGCRKNARSPNGALGLMQLMPRTAQWLGVSNPFSPRENVAAGAKYLAMLLKKFEGNTELALAAYNAGPYRVKRGSPIQHAETRQFVKRVLSYYGVIRQANRAPDIQA